MIGSYVPASQVYVGDFDRIYTRLNSNETISIQMSSFAIDAKQISEALVGSTPKSLILVDEFGKGTNEIDGQSLVFGLLKYWSDMQKMLTPHIYFSTHYYEILDRFEVSFKENNQNMDYLTFNYVLHGEEKAAKSSKEILKEIVHLYTLKRGITSSSNAISIASRVGLDESIISRATQIYSIFQTRLIGSIYDPSINYLEILDTKEKKNILHL